ncbi:chromate transporter [Blautia sp. An81]|uniref:chromate transporter n=1 Tax=Blautia sp. An81 TaxID=1965659 RepID=UPI000B391385|nr:hypothetical protein B5G33_17840 [Blautia sp. An81]
MTKEKPKQKHKIFRLITAMVQCGLLGFGGGNALIPVLYRKAVEEYGLVSKEDFEEAVVVASITPAFFLWKLHQESDALQQETWECSVQPLQFLFPVVSWSFSLPRC